MTLAALIPWILLGATIACGAPQRRDEPPPPRAPAPSQAPMPAGSEASPSDRVPSAAPREEDTKVGVQTKGPAPDRALRAAVSALASAGLGEARPARVLAALADAIELLPKAALAQDELERLREDVERLRGLEAIDLDRADHVKAGFERALAAFRSIATATLDPRHGPFLAAASEAVGRLDEQTPLGLQRAELQDAARTLADAVLIALRFGRCPAERPEA